MSSPPVAYYNECDPFAAQWLKNLIAARLIAYGDVDERSIEDVCPVDLIGYTQCHFFAGIGGWSYAARLAGWPDSRPLWTGSCPCQPFSAAGKRTGMSDERHLWPAFFHLIQNGKPRSVPIVGEQVASPDGLAWLDLVQADLEGAGYACWAADICAAGFGAPIIRQRLWWVACAEYAERRPEQQIDGDPHGRDGSGWSSNISGMERPQQQRLERHTGDGRNRDEPGWNGTSQTGSIAEAVGTSWVASANGGNSSDGELQRSGEQRFEQKNCCSDYGNFRSSPTNGFWRSADWLLCRDDKWRPVEPGTFPLAHGVPNRVGRLRGYGNAINAQAAAEFLRAYVDCCPED